MNAGVRRLIVFPGALGDFLLLAPALAALRARGAAVELSVPRALAELAHALFPAPMGPPADGAAMRSLFSEEIDPALARWLRGAARVDAWFAASDALERHAGALDVAEVRRHAVERGDAGPHAAHAYAAALAVPPVSPRLPAEWTAAPAAAARPRALVIHPGAGAVAKRWSRSGFRHLADAWRTRSGDAIVLLGPAEEDDGRWWRATGHDVVSGVGLRDAATLLASARHYVGNDCGISHLAGLLDLRGAVLFGPTRAARWRPLGGDLTPITVAGRSDEDIEARLLARLAAGDVPRMRVKRGPSS